MNQQAMRGNPRAAQGDRVLMRWSAKLDNGDWLEDEIERERPIWVIAGLKNAPMRPVFAGLIGMQIGERKSLTVSPDEAFGVKSKLKMFDVVTASLPRPAAVGEWLEVDFSFFKGDALVVARHGARTSLDGNHPHAGRTLHVEFEVLDIART